MPKMIASDFDGIVEIICEKDLLEFLKKRPVLNANHFQLTFDQVLGYLDVLVKGDDSVIYYLDDPSGVFVSCDDSFKSTIHDDDNNDKEFITFYSNAKGEPQITPRYQLISAESMERAALEFFHAQVKPTSIGWDEL